MCAQFTFISTQASTWKRRWPTWKFYRICWVSKLTYRIWVSNNCVINYYALIIHFSELIDFSGNYTERAPIPYLNIAVRQNGQYVDTAINVHPGTPLEMIIFLDDTSAPIYGLLASFLKVTDNTPRKQEEVIILKGYYFFKKDFWQHFKCWFLAQSNRSTI